MGSPNLFKNALNKFILKNVSTRAFIVALTGKPVLLNFINEAINGSKSIVARFNALDVPNELVMPGLAPSLASIPLYGSILSLSLSLSLS